MLLNRILRNTDPCMELVEAKEPLKKALVHDGGSSLQNKTVIFHTLIAGMRR